MANNMRYSALKKPLFFSFIFLVYSYLFYKNVHICRRYGILYNMYQHSEFAKDWLKGVFISHPGFHILTIIVAKSTGCSFINAALALHIVFTVITAFMVYKVLWINLRDKYSENVVLLSTAFLLLVIAIYIPGFSWNMYLGQGNPNMVNSPTLTATKPFMLLSILFFINLLTSKTSKDILRNSCILSITLLISVFMKPCFAYVFIPAMAIYLLWKQTRNIKLYIYSICIIAPAIIVIMWQAYNMLLGSGPGYSTTVEINPFYVWRTVSPNIPISILLATAFPVVVFLLRPKNAIRNTGLVISWLMVIIGILEYALLMEGEPKTFSYNWMWGYNLALLPLFIFSAIEFLTLYKDPKPKRNLLKTGMVFAGVIFLLHFASGIAYFYRLLNCGPFI